MSRNSAGSYSLPTNAVNPAVTGSTISSTAFNATMNDFATETTNSLDRQGRGGMLAALQLSDGTSTAPGLTFGTETNSGLYRAGTGDVRLVVNAVEVAKFKADSSAEFVAPVVGATGMGFSMANPGSSTAFQNRVTPKNVLKAWATVKTDGVGGISVLDGFNIASVAINAGNASARLTFAQAFLNANYLPVSFPGFAVMPVCVGLSGSANKTTALIDIGLRDSTAAGQPLKTNLNAAVYEFYVAFYGAQ